MKSKELSEGCYNCKFSAMEIDLNSKCKLTGKSHKHDYSCKKWRLSY